MFSRFAVLQVALVCAAFAQAPPAADFNDLARRAEAALDTQPAEAAKLYQQALAIKPDWAEGWFYLGGALYQLDRYAEGTDAFRTAVAGAPQNGPAWAFLGLCEAEMDNTEQALADIRKGEELGLGSNQGFETAVRVKAAQLLIRSSAFDEAMVQLQPLARANVNAQAVVDTMGLCALAAPNKLSELSRERRAVVSLAGKASWSSVTQHPEEAAAAYREMVEKYPNEPGVHYANGLYLMETDLKAALAEFQKEVQINPKNWPARIVLASLELKQGAPEQSVQSLREAMKLAPARFRWLVHAEMGRANLAADNLDAAISELQAALRLKTGNAQVHYFLAQAYRRAGRMEEAQKENAEFQKLKVMQDPLGVPSLRPFSYANKN